MRRLAVAADDGSHPRSWLGARGRAQPFGLSRRVRNNSSTAPVKTSSQYSTAGRKTPTAGSRCYFGYLNRNQMKRSTFRSGPRTTSSLADRTADNPRTSTHDSTASVQRERAEDFGKSELVWTLTSAGKTRTAYGHLRPDWEITPDGGSSGTRTTQEARANKPPTLVVSSVAPPKVGTATSLDATVSDDGLPVPRGRMKAAVGQETPSTLIGARRTCPRTCRGYARSQWRRRCSGGWPAVRWMVYEARPARPSSLGWRNRLRARRLRRPPSPSPAGTPSGQPPTTGCSRRTATSR